MNKGSFRKVGRTKMRHKHKLNCKNVAVTVVCISYNQEEYIAEALESFVNQKTTFLYQIFVGDDCSSDRTPEIIIRYSKRYPGIVVPFLREKNLGPQRNSLSMCFLAKSPYIAVCDGDDYWIDPLKLQKQYEYMESNPDINFSYGKTEIMPTPNWSGYGYYIPDDQGRYILPDCLPNYKRKEPPLSAFDFMNEFMVGHTSSFFFRWNYALDIPDWYYEGVYGDMPLRLMQMGSGKAGYIDDVVSAYRVNETGVFSSYEFREELFYHTRLEYVRWIWGMLVWYEQSGISEYPKVQLENRLKLEVNNLIWACTQLEDYAPLQELIDKYPGATTYVMRYYLSAHSDRVGLEKTLGWDGYQRMVREGKNRAKIKQLNSQLCKKEERRKNSKAYKLFSEIKRSCKRKVKNAKLLYAFNHYAKVPKRNNIWVVSGFRANNYMDNTKYFYEYVFNHHPEVDIYWLTKSKEIYAKLAGKGMPVLLVGTQECVDVMSKASLAFVDHYASTDFPRMSGFNANTRVVQLWHGAALKRFVTDGTNNTGESTVVPSDKMLPADGDSLARRTYKRFLFRRYAYRRELYERYLLFLTPGLEMQGSMGKAWGIPESSYFMAGYPRVAPLIVAAKSGEYPEKPCIVYAPTYRWDPALERSVIEGFLTACPKIQSLMERIDGTFALRLHPHTWRNYKARILSVLRKHDRIFLDQEKDAYAVLPNYTIAVSDYSSIVLDYALMDRPVVFFTPDFEQYHEKDCGVIEDYEDRIPGPWTHNWQDTLVEIEKYVENPTKDLDWTKKRMAWFYNPDTTDELNSTRIVEELKRRLGMFDS